MKKSLKKTPLRYPGGKSRLVKPILKMAPDAFTEYREPFLGGGSVLFALQDHELQARKAGDLFEPLFNFWDCVKESRTAVLVVVNYLKIKYPNGRDLFEHCKEDIFTTEDKFVKAACYFILNRITYSGLTLSGGYSQASFDSRFNPSHIQRLHDSQSVIRHVELYHKDYKTLLHESSDNDVWIFLDPPYDIKSDNLYGSRGNTHKGFDHVEFAEECKKSPYKWLVTYNDNENIRKLFKWANIYEHKVKYSMNSKPKEKVELFITNY